MDLSDLFDWAQAGILDGLASGGGHDGLIRRNLQTAYAHLLAQMLIAPDKGTPSDAALSRGWSFRAWHTMPPLVRLTPLI